MTTKPRVEKKEWHLVCVTRKGKVSMLQNLTMTVARETYKRLRPGEHPEDHKFEKCKVTGEKYCQFSDRGGCWSYDSDDDHLDRVDIIGPLGKALDPWFGVEPRVIKHVCRCEELYREGSIRTADGTILRAPLKKPSTAATPVMEPAPAPKVPRWDKRRADFWNNPRLWDRIRDTRKQMCWEMI